MYDLNEYMYDLNECMYDLNVTSRLMSKSYSDSIMLESCGGELPFTV